jgi:DNA-binding CsgD family transcriptional regulator
MVHAPLGKVSSIAQAGYQAYRARGTDAAPTALQSGDSEDAANTDIASSLPNYTKHTDAWIDFVYGDLSPTDKLVMDMTLGRNGRRKASTQDIARRLNISPGAVSQRAAKIQAMIDTRHQHNF